MDGTVYACFGMLSSGTLGYRCNPIFEQLAKADSHIHNKSDKDDWMANDDFWDDKVVFYEKEWKIVLVDFGFAKACEYAALWV